MVLLLLHRALHHVQVAWRDGGRASPLHYHVNLTLYLRPVLDDQGRAVLRRVRVRGRNQCDGQIGSQNARENEFGLQERKRR